MGQKYVPVLGTLWNPGKWNRGLKPAVPWCLNFDPYPNMRALNPPAPQMSSWAGLLLHLVKPFGCLVVAGHGVLRDPPWRHELASGLFASSDLKQVTCDRAFRAVGSECVRKHERQTSLYGEIPTRIPQPCCFSSYVLVPRQLGSRNSVVSQASTSSWYKAWLQCFHPSPHCFGISVHKLRREEVHRPSPGLPQEDGS